MLSIDEDMRTLTALLLLSILLFVRVNDAHAAAVGRIVTGTVADSSGNPLENVTISATCLGNPLSAPTDNSGAYSLRYEKLSHCLKGSTVKVIASKDDISSTVSKKMGDVSITIDLALEIIPAPPASVPEFGAATGITAVSVGALGFYLLKRFNICNT